MIHSLLEVRGRLGAPCVDGTPEERFASHLIAVCVYPTLADVVGMRMVSCRSFLLNRRVYAEFAGVDEIEKSLCRKYVWLLESTHTEVRGVKIYTLLLGRLDDLNALDIQAGGYGDLFAYNEWGVSKDAVSSIINV
jgi:hypothetical protein